VAEKIDGGELKVRIVLDDKPAAKAADRLGENLEKAGERGSMAGEHAGQAWGDSVKHVVEFAAGELLFEGVEKGFEKVVDVAKEAAEAFLDNERDVRKLANSMLLLDTAGDSIQAINIFAHDLQDELENVGKEVGRSGGEMNEVFGDIFQRGGHTIDQTMKLTEAMAQAGRAVPGGPGQLSEAFANIEMGIIRARNPLVQMIAATGLLHGNAKQVAGQMMKMSVDKQMELAEKAVEKMGVRMEALPKTWDEQIGSIKAIIEQFMEDAGGPIVDPLMRGIAVVRDSLLAHSEEIKEAFSAAGDAIGGVLDRFFTDGDDFANYLMKGAEFIKDAADSIKLAGMGWDWFIDELEREIATLQSLMPGAVGKGGLETLSGRAIRKAEELAGGERGMAQVLTPDEIEGVRKSMHDAMMAAGHDEGEFQAQWSQVWDLHNKAFAAGADAAKATAHFDATEFANIWKWAASTHNKGIEKYIASVIVDSEAMKSTLASKGPEIFGAGAQEFIKTLTALGPSGKKAAEEIKKGAGWRPDVFAAPPQVNFFNNTFQIHQDFRQEDPDRVILQMKKDLVAAGTNRYQARTATPMGL